MTIIILFILHWYSSLFFQTVFLHRYASHQMFTMSKTWERIFFFCTFLTQGASFLNPRAYAILHRLHHKYSDTKKDPHSPIFSKNIIKLRVKPNFVKITKAGFYESMVHNVDMVKNDSKY